MWYTYILASKKDWVLYIWVTSNLEKRIQEHKDKTRKWFTSKYNIDTLVRYQDFQDIQEAIIYEKKLKGRSRQKKIDLIEIDNPKRRDLVNKNKT